MEWNDMCKELVHRSVNGYSSASESEWFYEIDLAPLFTHLAMDMLANGQGIHVHPQAVADIVQVEYDDCVERCMLERAMWSASQAFFSDDKVKSKVYKCLTGAYYPALDEAIASCMMRARQSRSPQDDLRHVEEFTRQWIHDSMGRAWSALPSLNEDGDSMLTEDLMCKLFKRLLIPFGEDHPFSCISSDLTQRIGRPPHDWKFIRQAVRELITGEVPRGGRKRKAAPQPAGDWNAHAPGKRKNNARRTQISGLVSGEARADGGAKASSGHPKCTSAEDCLGTPQDQLVRHILNGTPADVYCITCWESFLQRNPSLEGEIVEDEAELDN
jgi:hypothetical protein